MFVDLHGQYRPPPEPEPPRRSPRPRLTRRQERALGWLVGFNIVVLLVAPIGGATLLQPLIAWLTG